MKSRPRNNKRRWLLCLLGAGVFATVVFGVWKNWLPSKRPSPPPSQEPTFPLPAYSESRYLNTGPDAQYVGTAVCAGCHGSKHASYLLTAHSRSLSDLDPKAEPPDGSFQHEKSGHSYRVYRRDGQLHHEEVLRTPEGQEIARIDLPVRYLIGSGNFSRSYLFQIDGFLQESPITWYASRKQWGMSPGYDAPQHAGFERQILLACLVCHTGHTEPTDTVHRFTIHEQAIGCESCHGRGSLHVAFQKADKTEPGVEDLTIVNPGKLSRPRLESLCGECHLHGPARVHLRGRQEGDYRPGMPLTDYHIDYQFDSGSEQMTVVGHMEQLRRSRCYRKSEDLTCLTCHDPHATEKPKDAAAFYRDKCLKCHTTQSCKLDHAQRIQKDATDNCVTCHMPRGDTEIPHVAFTHHRIGVHATKPLSPESRRVPELVPTDDVSQLGLWDQKRNLGLAYLKAAEDSQYTNEFTSRAVELLGAVYGAGLHDVQTVEGLAYLYARTDLARCKPFAREVLEAPNAPVEMRANALGYLAVAEARDRNFSAAVNLLKEVVRLRRHSNDWWLLGTCYLQVNQLNEALAALQQGLALRPDNSKIHASLAEAYRLMGDLPHTVEHREKADWLRRHGGP